MHFGCFAHIQPTRYDLFSFHILSVSRFGLDTIDRQTFSLDEFVILSVEVSLHLEWLPGQIDHVDEPVSYPE